MSIDIVPPELIGPLTETVKGIAVIATREQRHCFAKEFGIANIPAESFLKVCDVSSRKQHLQLDV